MNAKLPSLPGLEPNMEPGAARLLSPMKEILEVREGRRGDPLQRSATLQDLLDLGLASREQLMGMKD